MVTRTNSWSHLTLDNRTEFAKHQKIVEQLECKIYFCDPYKPYQKEVVENANTLIRTRLPHFSFGVRILKL